LISLSLPQRCHPLHPRSLLLYKISLSLPSQLSTLRESLAPKISRSLLT
jgi:hypothetical protein